MNDPSNNSINLPLQHSSIQNLFRLPGTPSLVSPALAIQIFQDNSNNIQNIFGLWGPIFDDDDEEMLDAETNAPINNFIQTTNMTIQTMTNRLPNWSPRMSRYIPLMNNFLPPQEPASGPVERAANGLIRRSFAEDSPKYKHVLSENGRSQIKFKKFNKRDFSDQEVCPITQDKFIDDQIVAQLPCKHIFEKEAIMKWVQNENASCPSCRFKLDSVEEEIKKNTPVEEARLTITNLLNFMERREQQQEEEDIQRAIMASLSDGADF